MMPNWLRKLVAFVVIVAGISTVPLACTYLVILYGQPGSERPFPGGGELNSPPQRHTDEPRDNTSADNRGTLEHPLIVKTVRTPEEAQQETDDRNEKSANDRRLTWATVALAFMTAGLVAYTGVLSHATRKLVRDAKDTAKRQLRAYVFIENAWLKQVAGHSAWEITYRVKNFGQTPASRVVVTDKGVAVDQVDGWTLPKPENASNLGSLAPSVDFVDSWTDKIEFVSLQDLRDERKTICLVGRIDYVDAFDEKRWTTFCYILTGDIPSDGEMEVHEYGNEYY